MGYAIAAAVAVPVGFLEQYGLLLARPVFRGGVWKWWVGRVILECLISAGALVVAVQLHVAGADKLYGWIAAGLVGPSLAKSHLAEVFRGDKKVAYGLISIYERARDIFADRIDELSATRQAAWISDTVFPTLNEKNAPWGTIADELKAYVESLAGLTEVERKQELNWISETRKEATANSFPDEKVRQSFVERAIQLRAWNLVESMIR